MRKFSGKWKFLKKSIRENLRFDGTVIGISDKWCLVVTAVVFSIQPECVIVIEFSYHH